MLTGPSRNASAALSLLDVDAYPFVDRPPMRVRATLYHYDFTRVDSPWARRLPHATVLPENCSFLGPFAGGRGCEEWWTRVRVREYMWGEPLEPLLALGAGADSESQAPPARPFDLVVASDVAYDHRVMRALSCTLESALEAGNPGDDALGTAGSGGTAGAIAGGGDDGGRSVLLAFRCSDVVTPETHAAERKFFAALHRQFSVSGVICGGPGGGRCGVPHVQLYSLRKK